MRLLRVIVVLLILAIGALTGYAYLGDMGAAPKEMRVPVELDLGAAAPSIVAPETIEAIDVAPDTVQDTDQPDAAGLD